MRTGSSQRDSITNVLVNEGFDKIDDLRRFVENRLGKMENQNSVAFWTDQEHMKIENPSDNVFKVTVSGSVTTRHEVTVNDVTY